MKHLKLFENFEKDKHNIASEVENILVELRDNGLDFNIAPPSNGYIYISITDENEETFWFNSIIMNRLLFLNDYLKNKYKNVTMKVTYIPHANNHTFFCKLTSK